MQLSVSRTLKDIITVEEIMHFKINMTSRKLELQHEGVYQTTDLNVVGVMAEGAHYMLSTCYIPGQRTFVVGDTESSLITADLINRGNYYNEAGQRLGQTREIISVEQLVFETGMGVDIVLSHEPSVLLAQLDSSGGFYQPAETM